MSDQEQSEVQAQLAPMTGAWSRYARLAIETPAIHGLLPRADSVAMAELAAESRWSTSEWTEPVRNAHSYGYALVAWELDHFAAYSAIASSSATGPVYAHLSLLRSLIEGAVVATWLNECGIGPERRIKRSLAYRLDNATNLRRIKRHDAAIRSAEAAATRTRDVAEAFGWDVQKRPPPSVGGEKMPDPKEQFSLRVFGETNEQLDQALWNYTSASAHGTFYAIQQRMREMPTEERPATLDPTGTVRALVTSAQHIAWYGTVAYLATRAAVNSHRVLHGWPLSSEQQELEVELAQLSDAAWKATKGGADLS